MVVWTGLVPVGVSSVSSWEILGNQMGMLIRRGRVWLSTLNCH
jgi:hypothetical protein